MMHLSVDVERPKLANRLCSFGLTEVGVPLIAGALANVGVGATTAGIISSVATPALIGAGTGALSAALTGGKPLKGALYGGLTGGALGGLGAAFPETMGNLGLGQFAGQPASSVNITPEVFGSNPGGYLGADAGSGLSGAVDTATGLDGAAMDAYGVPASGGGGGAATSGGGGPLSAQGLGGLKNASATSKLLGALTSLGGYRKPAGYGDMPNSSSTSSAQGPLFNANLQSSGYLNRTPTNPNAPLSAWYNYGAGPEQSFFNNNQIMFPQGTLNTGGALNRAHGGPAFVPGDSGGQDDQIPAQLSGGEYVLDAATMARLGDGNPAAGAKKMDEFRKQVARHAGAKKVIPPKAKSPLQYLRAA